MTSRRNSFDSTDTTQSNLSKNSEIYLQRIQQETNRIRRKRKDRKSTGGKSSTTNSKSGSCSLDSTNNSLGSASADFDILSTSISEGSAAVAVAERLLQKQEEGKARQSTTSTTTNSPSNTPRKPNNISIIDRSFESTLTANSPQKRPSWNDLVESTERSNRSFEEAANNSNSNLTLKSVQSDEKKSDNDSNPNPNSKRPSLTPSLTNSEEYDESEYLVAQRGDSIAEKNAFEDPPFKSQQQQKQQQKQQQSSSLNYFTGIKKKPKMNSSEFQIKQEEEAFQKKLIDEVLGKEAGDKVSMEKVMMIIWQFRDDKDVIKFMTRFVCKFAGSRDVFDGIEFYLPQLAHMMIHLETEWDDAILERFSLVIAQQSIHFALQLNWILAGAIEDYQPELPDGTPNPTYNPLYYFRCVKLLTNIERCVVYRRPRSQELQRLYEKAKITKAEMHSLEQADRRFTAMQITAPDAEDDPIFGGTLKYKRAIRTSNFKLKRWKTRYFAIEERMLNCYNTQGGKLIRSMPLEGATVQAMKTSQKYPNMFRVTNRSFEFRMRASSEEDRNKWISMLENEATTGRVFGHTDTSLQLIDNKDAQRVIEELTPSQRERYKFYRNEREFVRRLTDVAEDLRFKEPADRKGAAPGLMKDLEIPTNAYSPLMTSTDIFRRIHSTMSKDTRVFNTKARCPTVMYFLGVRGELEYKGLRHANMDIAEYIHLKFDSASDWKTTPLVKGNMNGSSETIEVELGSEPLSEIAEGNEGTESPSKPSSAANAASLMTPEPKKLRNNNDSFVWTGSFAAETPGKDESSPSKKAQKNSSPSRANRHLRKFLKESMVSVPRKLAHHLERKSTRYSSMRSKSGNLSDSSKSLTGNVPIANHASQSHGIGEDVYIGRSSVMDSTKIIKGKTKAGDIDQESINRAKKIVCGGLSWAEKSFHMLENVKNKPKDPKVQLEIVCLLSKSNDDLRQEVFVMQMIHYYKSVFIAAGIPLWLKTYKILSTSASTGLLEFMVDSTSLDGLKKSPHYPKEGGLRAYYEQTYGGPDSKSFKAAQRNFVQSLAAYSIVCYLLGLKDRHNGNIMIDMRGHLIHIDYGFCMGMCVGHEFTMERAPFKLTEEYVDVMGGENGEAYKEFQKLFVEGMMEARNKCQIALGLVEIMMYQSNYPCFSGRRYGSGQALRGFRERLMLDVPDNKVEAKAKALITKARDHWGTRAYDSFQQWSNGYAI